MSDLIEVRIPDMGDVDAVEVVEILVQVGDAVDAEASLVTLESDKASMDVPSPRAGVVKELELSSGDTVKEGDLVLLLEAAGDASPGAPAPASEDAPASEETARSEPQAPEPEVPAPADARPAAPAPRPPESTPAPAAPSTGALPPVDEAAFADAYASPSVRKLARELGADLGAVEGTGRKGRITDGDLKAWVKAALHSRVAAGGGGGVSGFDWPAMPAVDFSKFGDIEEKPLSRIQKVSKKNLHRSWLHVPHVTQHDEADTTELEAFRQAHKGEAKKLGFSLTPLAFLLKASAAALREFPSFNASLHPDGDKLILKKYVHIGVAVDTPDGLVVPVIRDVDRKGLFQLAEETVALSVKAREGKLTPGDFQGACFTISSLGGIGGTAFTPIVNAPEVAILGVSKHQYKPVWNGSEFEPRLMLPLSLSYDHRVIDGASAARFVVHLSGLLSDLKRLLL